MKALVLFSGGLDSTTCLAMAVKKYGADNVVALSVYYGQKHEKELSCASEIVKHYNVRWERLDMSEIFKESKCSLLSSSTEEIPETSYADQIDQTDGKPVSTYVPFRNGLFLSASASIAIAEDCEVIYYGIHADDSAGNAYPDCSVEFAVAMRKAIWIGSGKQVKIFAPFAGRTKADIVRKGLELGVPYELTWSCYEGKDKPCGVCGTCRDRAEAFRLNGVEDPALARWK